MTDPLAKFFLELLAYGGGSAAVAYLLFQFLGRSWIENKFKEGLERYKHEQALEIQRLRVEIDSMLSGVLKLQEREFDVLPKAWQKLDEAHGQVSWLVSPMQSYPDLNRMNSQELAEFFSTTELSDSQRQRIAASSNRTNTFIDIIFWHRFNKVRSSIGSLRDFVASNGIFLPVELKGKFTKIVELLWSALTSKQVGVEAEDHKLQGQGWEKIQGEVEPLYRAIELDIQQRLQSHGRRRVGF